MKSNLLILAAGILAGFTIGFVLANAMSKPWSASVQTAEAGASSDTSASNAKGAGPKLSEKELREAIKTTDARPNDIDLQKRFGLALYAYVNQTRNPEFLPDAARFLKRAVDSDPSDRNTTVSLANALFDLGQLGDAGRFAEARRYYEKALEMNPNDANVRTDLGLTYYFGTPQDAQSAIREYRKSLAIDPRHEQTLQNLATALVKTGNQKEAQKTIETLRSVNPKNPALPDLEAMLTPQQH